MVKLSIMCDIVLFLKVVAQFDIKYCNIVTSFNDVTNIKL